MLAPTKPATRIRASTTPAVGRSPARDAPAPMMTRSPGMGSGTPASLMRMRPARPMIATTSIAGRGVLGVGVRLLLHQRDADRLLVRLGGSHRVEVPRTPRLA